MIQNTITATNLNLIEIRLQANTAVLPGPAGSPSLLILLNVGIFITAERITEVAESGRVNYLENCHLSVLCCGVHGV